MDSRCHALPFVVVAMYWSSLAVSLLGQTLGRRWQEGDRRLQQITPVQEPNIQPTGPCVAVNKVTRRSNIPTRARKHFLKTDNDLTSEGLGGQLNNKKRLDSDCPCPMGMTINQREVETVVSKRIIGTTVFYKVKWRDRPESHNTWERKTNIDWKLIPRSGTKLLREPDAEAISSPYPYGRKPDWPSEHHTRFGRPVRPSWKLIDRQITKLLTSSFKERFAGGGKKFSKAQLANLIRHTRRRNI